MIKAIIIEDEINARGALKKMLNIVTPNVNIIAETGFIKEAIALIKTKKPDLIFLDIELEDGTSFEILKHIDNIDFKIIFTTAYNQYAIEAFKFSAVDYLLKPIDPSELKEAINRTKHLIDTEKQYQELNVLKNNLENENKKIVLRTTEQRHIINIQDIIRLEADTAYTLFVTQRERIIVSKNLKYYQDILGSNFLRCHQSHLVNSLHVTTIQKKEVLILSNQEEVPVSSRKKKEVFQFLENL